MPRATDHPLIYEINARIWLDRLGCELGEVPEREIERLSELGFDFVWLMGVWRTGDGARRQALAHEGLRVAYDAALSGWTADDVGASPYAIAEYRVAQVLGGDAGLARFRARLAERGIGLILDFVPNHVGVDHAWVEQQPDWMVSRPYIGADPAGLAAGDRLIAFGRDPYFPPWTDTVQLDHRNRGLRGALVEELRSIAGRCDGVRCDMAMLALEDVFARTWTDWPVRGERASGEFWATAIPAVRRSVPAFLFVAEAYWDLEYRLQQLGFDYTYDKRLYDRLRADDPAAVQAHLLAEESYQRRSLRFVENHDEERAAATWTPERLRVAALAAATLPGARLFHQGQLDGARHRAPVQLLRWAEETPDPELRRFYERLLGALGAEPPRRGLWRLAESGGRGLAWSWDAGRHGQWLVLANPTGLPIDLRVRAALLGLSGRNVELYDLLGGERAFVDGDALTDPERGAVLLLGPWEARIYDVR